MVILLINASLGVAMTNRRRYFPVLVIFISIGTYMEDNVLAHISRPMTANLEYSCIFIYVIKLVCNFHIVVG